jgi:hypothetical protein
MSAFLLALPALSHAQGADAKGKDPNALFIAIIAACGVGAGAGVTALAAAYAARQKIREVELTYEQKLRDNYLSNARQYTNGIYVPISMALRKLGDAYKTFQADREIDDEAQAEARFREACDAYESSINELFEKGADAFLTTQLEERLVSFNSFLRASLKADEEIAIAVLTYEMALPVAPWISTARSIKKELRGKWAQRFGSNSMSLRVLGAGMYLDTTETVAAPLTSDAFERRFSIDVTAIKYLIKEVTLGAHIK